MVNNMITLYNNDCFNIFPQLEDKSIDLVLCDMPYGTTGVACKTLNRQFIGIEKEEEYYNTSVERINNA